MKIQGIKQNKTETPNFGGIKIARVKPLKAQVEEDVFIYSLDKEKDRAFCDNLADKLIKSTKERMNTEKKIEPFQFIYCASLQGRSIWISLLLFVMSNYKL